MSYLIYISYTPCTVYVIHNLCICLPVNGWWDPCLLYLRITWKSVDSLPSGNAWSERCLLWIAPQLPMVRLASFITSLPPSAVHHPNICSPGNTRSECWWHWPSTGQTDVAFYCPTIASAPVQCSQCLQCTPARKNMMTLLPMDLSLAPEKKELKACSMVSHFLTDSYFLVSQVQEPLCAPITKLTRRSRLKRNQCCNFKLNHQSKHQSKLALKAPNDVSSKSSAMPSYLLPLRG